MSFLKADLLGHLGQGSTIVTHNGKQCLGFSVAVSKNYTDGQGVKHTNTKWISVSYWSERDLSKLAQYLKKGQQVFCSGEIDSTTYQDKNGKWNAQIKLNANKIELLGSSQNNTQQNTEVSNQEKSDIPF